MYRVGQFLEAITARIGREELDSLAPLLGPTGMTLFARLSRGDQRHSLAVFRELTSQGADEGLLIAALLHDVGKSAGRLGLPYRVAAVLLNAWSPSLLRRFESWRTWPFKPFYLAARHPELGAEMLRQAGFSAEVVELVRAHHVVHAASQPGPFGRQLAALVDADSKN